MADLTAAQLEQMLHDLDAHPQEHFWSCRRETARKLILTALEDVRRHDEIVSAVATATLARRRSRSPA